MSDSLISRAAEQPDLLTSAEMSADFFAGAEQKGTFTGERLFARQPRLYHAVKSLLAERIGVDRIAGIMGVSVHTVLAVRDRERGPIAVQKEELAGTFLQAARLAAESVLDDLADPVKRAKIPALQKAMIAGIATEKSLLLRGEATMRMDIEIKVPEHDAFNTYVEGLRTCLPGESGGTKGGAVAAVPGAGNTTVTDQPTNP